MKPTHDDAAGPARATSTTWMFPPQGGWTYEQVKDLHLPYDWELVEGGIVIRDRTSLWHDQVRDELFHRLRATRSEAYAVNIGRWTFLDERTVVKPDIVVQHKRDLDVASTQCTPVDAVVLAVEVAAPRTRGDDRFRKPGLLAEAGVPYFWRIDRRGDGSPVVHEFWRHHEAGTFAPPDHPTHRGRLKTDVPFPVDVDLAELVEL